MLPKIFEMFTQVDRTLERSQGGLGIGLSLVKSLAELHGGSIEARSDGPDRDSEFVARLPAIRFVIRPCKTSEAPIQPSSRRILVVDDNRDVATSLVRLLTLMGNDTTMAHDGLAALDIAEQFRPDVIFLGIGMPKLNGYDAASRIRQQPWGQKMLLVALTGWGQEEDKRRTQEAGFNAHMVKPVDPDDLEKFLAGLQNGESGLQHSRFN